MTSILSVLAGVALFAVSHIGGEFIGTVLAKFGLAGFGGKAARAIRVGRALAKLVKATRGTDRHQAAREELLRWLEEHDPNRETPIAKVLEDGTEAAPPAKVQRRSKRKAA